MSAPDSAADLLSTVYSSQEFSVLATAWQASLSQHFQSVFADRTKVLNWSEPTDAVAFAESLLTGDTLPEEHEARFRALLGTMLSAGQNLHHPGYVGHQVPANAPAAGLFDAVGSMTNQPMAIYEMGPWATAVEHSLVRAMCGKVGWKPDDSTGVLTHGGSLANLTALLTARNIVFPGSWEKGVPKNAVLISHADAHYCVARSAGILGMGTENILSAPLDAKRRMCPSGLDAILQECQSTGRIPLAVVCCACATPIGAFDPVDRIADVCERHGVWLHVDAAHGGSVLMSRRHRDLLKGIDRADSLVWDAHKMMFVPALCAAVLFRNREHRFETFAQDAPYLFDPDNPGMAEFDNGVRTVECTKRALGFGLWGLWSLYGEEIFEQLVDRVFARCQFAYQRICSDGRLAAMHEPDCNILVFRYLPEWLNSAPIPEVNRVQRGIRSALVMSGDFYIVQTTIDGQVCLRMCFMNPMTDESRIDALLERICEIGATFYE